MSSSLPETRTFPPAPAVDSAFMLETIALDLNLTGLEIATIAMVLNAWVETNPDWTLHAQRGVLVDNAKIMQLALRYAGDSPLPEALLVAISKLYHDVSRAKVEAGRLMATNYGEAERRLLPIACKRWRKLADDAARRIIAVAAAPTSLPPIVAKDAATLIALLTEAANGDARRVRPNGEIKLPKIEQRRRTARMAVKIPCQIVLADRTVPGVLEDVSREGARIRCAHALADGEALALAFVSGRRLRANVVRWAGDVAGLRLETALPASDPLFMPGSAARA